MWLRAEHGRMLKVRKYQYQFLSQIQRGEGWTRTGDRVKLEREHRLPVVLRHLKLI
jgi:hypothetical protein